IVRLLESGTIPWHQPWKGGNQWPQNFVSRKVYRGINLFLLNAARYPSPFWLTFKQVQSLGGSVKKGERSFPVVFWKIFKEEGDAEARRIPFLRYYSVFNLAQCEGIAVSVLQPVETSTRFQPIDRCEQVMAAMPKPPAINHHGGRACYSPSLDEISMPEAKAFESSEGYYSTLFHELTHATGHVSRLNRKEVTEQQGFGSDPYSREELVAEMGAAFLCGHCEIENKTIDQSASYIQHWLQRLKEDRKLVVHAAAQAQKACDFILDVERKEDEGPTENQPKEFKVVALRECPTPENMALCDTPEKAADYWQAHVAHAPHFNPECECFVVLMLNTRRRVKGHQLISIGTQDTILVHPREVFRGAVIAGAAAIVMMHNHPSGEATPSEADIKVTRDLIRAGQLMKIEVLDHIIMGRPSHSSLRELGYFYS
ncbi:MAG TPA: zincin-like metallopeptidase domain-containing protein, partial [Verrucomicrobiae bacterium]|nr:zincin-like metallopeptidase domain-containing protein [Verrucomicrobiae bacterium]